MDDILEIAIPETNNLSIDKLREFIAQLATTEEGQPLEHAMRDLKIALKQNPAACSLMLDEDIGLCVAQLKRMTNKGIIADLDAKAEKKPKLVITKDVLDNLTMDDLK